MKIINHKFNGLMIAQRRHDGYINLTQMAKAYGKRVADWKENEENIALLALFKQNPIYKGFEPLISLRGRNGGTWGHPDIAIQFAQWLDRGFALQVSRWIRDWMTNGKNPIVADYTPTDLLTEIEHLENLIISIRSQTRIFHTGSHQPADDHLVKSLHSISHNQLNIINSAIERLQRLKQVAEMNSELESDVDIELPISKPEPNNQPPTNSTMNNITAANFIDSIPVVTKEATVRFTVDLPESMHRELSILAAKQGVSKADIVRLLLDDALKDVNE